MEYFSQDGQDKFIVNLFRRKHGGIFLDIGAYDGLNFSNSIYLEKELFWKGLCIEPNPIIFDQLKKNRSCICLNCCIGEVKGTFSFLSISGHATMLSGLIEMFDKKHLNRIDSEILNFGGEKKLIDVDVLPLREILEDNDFKTIDYCNIDVEGGEMSVLRSIDFSKISIKVFTIENNYGSKEIRNFLRPLGYSLITKLGADEVYEFNSKSYAIMLSFKVKRLKFYLRKIKNRLMAK